MFASLQVSPPQSIYPQAPTEASTLLQSNSFIQTVKETFVAKFVQVSTPTSGLVLRLVLKTKPFQVTLQKEKNIEYRRVTPYWTSRVMDRSQGTFKKFEWVEFSLGYQRNRSQVTRRCLGIRQISTVKRAYSNGLYLSVAEYPFKRRGYYGIYLGHIKSSRLPYIRLMLAP